MSDQVAVGVVGESGQVACALKRVARLRGASEHGVSLVARGRPEVDLCKPASLEVFLDEVRPGVVVNAGAYTAVDKAESEREAAFAVNAHGSQALAEACEARGVPLIHISTDYVFDGAKGAPYVEDDLRKPGTVYGASKAAGEVAIAAAAPRHVILRTAWVYGLEGGNFVRTMLRLGAERDELGVVCDQHGTPTFADDIAEMILKIAARVREEPAESDVWGVYHFTNGGATTWHGFAEAIFAHAAAAGLKVPRDVKPIGTADYPTPAKRPAYSVLDCSKIERVFGVERDAWDAALARAMPGMLLD